MHRLTAGDVAPDFAAMDLFGNRIDLAAFRGTHVLLSFFRNAACALCNLRVHHLIERHAALQSADVATIVVFESPVERVRRSVGRQGAPFPIIADPDARLYDLYRVETSETKVARTGELPGTLHVIAEAAAAGFPLTPEDGSNFLRMPADFLIGPTGVVLHAHYAQYVWDHVSLDAVESLASVRVSV
jgi:peroxiredoxin